MSRFCTLRSSSKGNCAYLSGGGTSVLVDAGLNYKQLLTGCSLSGFEPEELAAVLITHEHTDHIRGLRVLLKRLRIPVYASEPTLVRLEKAGHLPPGVEAAVLNGPVRVGSLEVSPFDTPHDAAHPIGLRVRLPDGRRVGVATDLGHVSETVMENLSGCDLVLLESNYDQGMLLAGPYPYPLKRRISGETGHLSNDARAIEILRLARGGTTRFVLGHLSETNNHPAVAGQTVRAVLEEAGLQEALDYILTVAPAGYPHPMIIF